MAFLSSITRSKSIYFALGLDASLHRLMYMKTLFLVFLLISSGLSSVSQAYVAHEVASGIIQLHGTSKGLKVTEVGRKSHKQKNKWVYFCISEAESAQKSRCFYAKPYQVSGLQAGTSLSSVEYALSPRVLNSKNLIPIGPQHYFYPVKIVYR